MSQILIRGSGGVDTADLALSGVGEHLAIDDTEASAVTIALATERGSWWGDTYGERFGSRLHELLGRGMTPEVLTLAEQYVREALAKWVESGWKIEYTATKEPPNTLRIQVRLLSADRQIATQFPILV
jgi:phage gp46-like protein